MPLPRSESLAAEFTWLDSVGSTNAALLAQSTERIIPSFSVVVTDDQTEGRGRLDRVWSAPRGASLAISVFWRPSDQARPFLSWVPLVAGLAMTNTVAALLSHRADDVTLKWPNDVLVSGQKISGILVQLTHEGDVVIGAGLNTAMTDDQLPVPTATSLVVEGASEINNDTIIATYLEQLFGELSALDAEAHEERPDALEELRMRVEDRCDTLGRTVHLNLPDATSYEGSAIGLDSYGHLLLEDAAGTVHAVTAGDVVHARAR